MKLKYYPTFLIVGAGKSGTTSLYNYLKNHPQIHMSKIKEPWFFSIVDLKREEMKYLPKYVTYNIKDYESLFISSKLIRGEASPAYLYWYKHTIKNIMKYHPRWKELKIIMILRNPAERAYSQYLHAKRKILEKRHFYEVLKDVNKFEDKDTRRAEYYLDYFGPSRYSEAVKSYLKHFKFVKIYLFEDLTYSIDELFKDLQYFLNVDLIDINKERKYNVNKGTPTHIYNLIKKYKLYKLVPISVRKSQLYSKNVKYLLNNLYYIRKLNIDFNKINRLYFKEDIKELEKIINRDLSHWL